MLSQHDVTADRAGKAWYRPSIAWASRVGGSHGNLHPTARFHCRAWRRGYGLAVSGASAAAGDAGDRVSPRPSSVLNSAPYGVWRHFALDPRAAIWVAFTPHYDRRGLHCMTLSEVR
jgi:hypothetical protein